MKSEVKVISEAAMNHFGSPWLMMESIIKSIESGADFVKFQLIDINNLYALGEYEYGKYDINEIKYVNKIIDIKPDLIISSCSLIFKKEILSLPKYGCINRHSSLLPSNGGVYPVFHSISKGEKYSGVTIHCMTSKIDEGKILAQKKILNKDNNMSKIYKDCFSNSSELILMAIDNLINEKYLEQIFTKNYNSFPSNDDWNEFRKNNGKFI